MILRQFLNVNIVVVNLKNGVMMTAIIGTMLYQMQYALGCGENSQNENAEQLQKRLGRTYEI